MSAAKEILLDRTRKDGSAREEDLSEEMIRKRLRVESMPQEEVEKHYIMQGVLEKGMIEGFNHVIDANRSVEDVLADIEAAIAEHT